MMFRTIMLVLGGVFVLNGCATTESRIQKIEAKYPQWDKATVQKVAGRQVEVGMTREMVYEALGKPDAVSHEGDEEKWGYAELMQNGWNFYERFVRFIYFKDRKVIKTEETGRYGPKKGDWHRHRGY